MDGWIDKMNIGMDRDNIHIDIQIDTDRYRYRMQDAGYGDAGLRNRCSSVSIRAHLCWISF